MPATLDLTIYHKKKPPFLGGRSGLIMAEPGCHCNASPRERGERGRRGLANSPVSAIQKRGLRGFFEKIGCYRNAV